MSLTRGVQDEYNLILDGYGAANKSYHDCVDYLSSLGFTQNQANNAVHVYRKGGQTRAAFRLSANQRDLLLDSFGAPHKTPKESVEHLMKQGARTDRPQAPSTSIGLKEAKSMVSTYHSPGVSLSIGTGSKSLVGSQRLKYEFQQ